MGGELNREQYCGPNCYSTAPHTRRREKELQRKVFRGAKRKGDSWDLSRAHKKKKLRIPRLRTQSMPCASATPHPSAHPGSRLHIQLGRGSKSVAATRRPLSTIFLKNERWLFSRCKRSRTILGPWRRLVDWTSQASTNTSGLSPRFAY